MLVGLTRDVLKHLGSLYTLFNQLRSLTNRLDQGIKLLNQLRTLLID